MHVDEIPALGWKLEAAEYVRRMDEAGIGKGVVARFGAECVLFASGFPRFDPRLELLRVRWAPNLAEPAKAAILGGNAASVLATGGLT